MSAKLSIIVLLLFRLTDSYGNNIGDSLIKREKALKYLETVGQQYGRELSRIAAKSNVYIKKLESLERDLTKSVSVREISQPGINEFETQLFYGQLLKVINDREILTDFSAYRGKYFPFIDSVETSLRFIMSFENLRSDPEVSKLLNSVESRAGELYAKITSMESVVEKLEKRKQLLISKIEKLGKSKLKALGKFQKELFYYNSQMQEILSEMNEPGKLLKRGFNIFRESGLFASFFGKYSAYAAFFGSAEYRTSFEPANFPGLQTRASVEEKIREKIGLSSFSGSNAGNDYLIAAQGQFGKLKSALISRGLKSSQDELPNFQANTVKTKSFSKRIEYGFDIQSTRPDGVFPTTSDIAVFIGYKLSDKFNSGVGIAYKIGWGTGFNDVKITHQGFGFRTYVNYSVLRLLSISGGAEFNYRSMFSRFDQLSQFSQWQKSALIGVRKEYNIARNRKGSVQLYYDLFHNIQLPKTQPLIFRMGYVL